MNNVLKYAHRLTSFALHGMVLRLLVVLSGVHVCYAQSERDHPSGSPFALDALAAVRPDIEVRQIAPVVLPMLPPKQTPQAFPPVQYKTSGKEFYVVFLASVSSDQGAMPLRRVYVSSRAHVRVKISHVGGSWSQSFEALPRSLTPVTLPSWASLDRVESEAAYKRVFKIEAEDDVAVYALSPNYLSSDGFLVLPKESLGREYVVASVRNALWYGSGALTPSMGGDPYPRSEFGVAAIEDGTEVTINLTAQSYSRRFQKGFYYKFTLNRGEVIQFMARDTGRKAFVNYYDNISKTYIPKMSWVGKEVDSTDCDLTGSQVLSNKPVAVFSGHERASVPDVNEFAWDDHPDVSRDHLIEQMPPAEVWGKRFIVIASSQNVAMTRPKGGDIVRVMPRNNGTLLSVNGVVRDTLNVGEYSQFVSGEVAYIETSEPALVVKYLATADPASTPGIGDPDMTVVPPLENMSTFYALPTIQLGNYFTEHYITLIIDTAALYTTKLNGLLPDNTAFKALPNLPYLFARYRTQFEGEQRVESSHPCYAETYGYGEVDSYSFSGGGDFHYIRGLSANDLNFGFVKLGDTRDSVTTVLSTIAPSPLADTITIFRYTWESGDTNVFGMLDTITTPIKLAPGQTLPVSFSFKPTKTGSFTAKLRVWSNNMSSVYIRLVGASGINGLKVDYNTVDFGRVRVGKLKTESLEFYVEGDNQAGVKLYFTDLSTQAKPYFFTTDIVLPGQVVPPNQRFNQAITFIPDSVGYFRSTLDFSNDGVAGYDTALVSLLGRGVYPEVVSGDLDFGEIRFDSGSLPKNLAILNVGDDTTRVLSVVLDSGDIDQFSLTIPTLEFPRALDTLKSPGNRTEYRIVFTPTPRGLPDFDGKRVARIQIITDEDTLYHYLRGRGVEPWFVSTPDTIDFGIIRDPLIGSVDRVTRTAKLRNDGTLQGVLDSAVIHHVPGDSIFFTIASTPTDPTFDIAREDDITASFLIKQVGSFFDSIVVHNNSRSRPLVYLKGSVEANFDLNDTLSLDTVTQCFDTIIRIYNPYLVPITVLDTAFLGNISGFSFFPGVELNPANVITIPPGEEFQFTLRYELPDDSINGTQVFLLLFSKPVFSNGILTSDLDTVRVTLYRKMQLLTLVTGKLPYNPNAKDAPFRLPIHIKGTRLGKPELDNMTIRMHFSSELAAPVGIDRTGSLSESTQTNGIPEQPQWVWDPDSLIMTIPLKGLKLSSDPTSNTLLFTLLCTTYLTTDTMVSITPEFSYEQKPCAYRILRDSAAVIYANECGDRTIRDLILRNPGFSIGHPYPDPSSASNATSVKIPYIALHDFTLGWKLYNELGTLCFTSEERLTPRGIGSFAIDRNLIRTSGMYQFEVTVRDERNVIGTYSTKFVVTE